MIVRQNPPSWHPWSHPDINILFSTSSSFHHLSPQHPHIVIIVSGPTLILTFFSYHHRHHNHYHDHHHHHRHCTYHPYHHNFSIIIVLIITLIIAIEIIVMNIVIIALVPDTNITFITITSSSPRYCVCVMSCII